MTSDERPPQQEPLTAAKRMRQAAQVLQDAIVRLEEIVALREQQHLLQPDAGQGHRERVAEQLEDIASGLEQVAAQMETTNA